MKYEFSAGGIVYKKFKTGIKWLIVHHAEHGGWVFPKGIIGDTVRGESIEEAAFRETNEEGGIKGKIIERLSPPIEYFYKRDGELRKKTVYYFLMEYLSGDPKNHDEEMLDAKFVTEEELRKILTYKNDLDSFENALKIFKMRKSEELF